MRIRSYIEAEWALAQAREAVEREIQELRDDYDVIIERSGDLRP